MSKNTISSLEIEENEDSEEKREPAYVQTWLIFYSVWNVFFGIIMIFTAFLLDAYGLPSRLTRFVGVCYILAAALCFFAKTTRSRFLFVVLIIFGISSALLTLLTLGGFVYSMICDKDLTRADLASNNLSLAIFDAFLHVLNFFVYIFSIYVFIICCKFENVQNDPEEDGDDRHKGSAENAKNLEEGSPATAISENI